MVYTRFITVGVLAVLLLGACSSIIPRPPKPVCGDSVDRGPVLVLDLTGFKQDEVQIAKAVQNRVGTYRLMTQEPVWIPKRSMAGKSGNSGSIASVQAIAADWGCNLVLLLDTKMSRNELLVQARKEQRVWLVHAGIH